MCVIVPAADDDSRSSESRRGRGEATVHGSAHYLWLLLLVTVLILVTSLVMAVFCCRRTGGSFVTSEPYSYMPGRYSHCYAYYRLSVTHTGPFWVNTNNNPGHQRNSLSVSAPVSSSAAGECGLLPQHNEHRMRSRCSRCCLTLCLVFTPAALCWWA